MAILSFGTAEGLAYRHDWNSQMNREQNNQLLDHQAQIDAANKSRMYGEDLAVKHLQGTWDNQQLKTFAEQRISEIGKFVSDNPDWETNIGQYSQYKRMKDELTENPIVDRSLRVQAHYGALTKYLAENPGSEYDPDIQAQLSEYDNYNKFGSVDGITANSKEFMFRSPDSAFDLNAAIGSAYKDMAATTVYDKRGVGIGATKTFADPQQLSARADALLSGPKGFNVKRAWSALSPEQQSLYGGDIYKWITTLGSSYVDQSVRSGTIFKPDKISGAGSKQPPFSAFYNDLAGKQPYQTWYSPHTKTLLPIAEDGTYQVNDQGVNIMTVGENGIPSFINLKSLNGQNVIIDPKSVASGINGANNEPYATVRMIVPVTDEMVNGENPILKNNSGWYEGWDADELNDTANDPAYAGSVELVLDSEGNPTGKVAIRAAVPLYATQTTVREYDKSATGQSMANKAEGLGLAEMSAQNQIAALQAMGGTDIRIMPNGLYIGAGADGNYYYADGSPAQ